MTPSRMLRPALALALGTLITSCSEVEGDADRFEAMARQVAAIPLDGRKSEPTAADLGLRPALSPQPAATVSAAGLKVEVMDPHELWDARDGLRRPFQAAGVASPPTVAPVAAVRETATVPRPATVEKSAVIQLGAYSSLEVARAAWADARTASATLRRLTPEFVPVQVNGKPFVRLRVKAPASGAADICRAIEVADPWCLRGV